MTDAPQSIHPIAEPVRQDAPTQEYMLRAMAANYAGGHCWDYLDGEVCTKAAAEISTLKARIEGLEAALREITECYVSRFGGNVIGLKAGVRLNQPYEIAIAALNTGQPK